MNMGRGFSNPQDNKFPTMGSWIPVTPNETLQTNSNPVADGYCNQFGNVNLQDFTGSGSSTLFFQELLNSNREAQQLNSRHNEILGYEGQMLNSFAGSSARVLRNDATCWNNQPLEALFEDNVPFVSSANRTISRGINAAANRPIPNLHSQVSNNIGGVNNMLATNQNHHYSRPLNLHSLANSNDRDSHMSSLSLVTRTQCSGSSRFDNSSCYNQIPQYGVSIPCQPIADLNSAPRRETSRTSSVADLLCAVAKTPNLVKKIGNNQFPPMNFQMDESSSHETQNRNNLVTTRQNETTQQQGHQLLQDIVDLSSAANSTPVKQNKDSEKGNNHRIDLNKTPQLKTPKPRKHRPKVIIEGKPKRNPPKPANDRSTNKNPSGKRKYIRRKPLKESATPPDVKETKDANNKTPARSCKRTLDFDLEKHRDEAQGKRLMEEMQERSTRSSDFSESPVIESGTGNNVIRGTNPASQIRQQNGFAVENSQQPKPSKLTSMDQMLTGYISLPERIAALKQLTTSNEELVENLHGAGRILENRNTDPCQYRYRQWHTPIQQQVHSEGINQFGNQVTSNTENERPIQPNNSQSTQLFSKLLLNSNEARGSKRNYSQTSQQMHPGTINATEHSSSRQEIFQLDEYHKSGSSCGTGSEIYKKKKIDNELRAGNYRMWSIVDGGDSEKVKRKGANAVKPNVFTPEMIQASPNYYVGENGSSQRHNNGINRLISNRYMHQMTCRKIFPKQQLLPQLQTNTESVGGNTKLTLIPSYASLNRVVNHNLLSPPPGKATAQEIEEAHKTYSVHLLKMKQAARTFSSKLVSSATGKALQEHARYNLRESPVQSKGSGSGSLVDWITWKLMELNLNERSNEARDEQNAIVPYKGDGALVPYTGTEFMKKRKLRPKVDLDPETERVWNLLMGKEMSEGAEGPDKVKEKWWEEEQNVFRGRADSFIARMHLVQGDRRFSPWKGSVVDSVIGVFLTQNVSDHLSSSAFMSLAARFPLKSASNNRTCDEVSTNILIKEPEVCIQNPEDTIWCEQLNERNSATPGISAKHWKHSATSGIGKCVEEAHSQSAEEEVISSQDSFDSSITQGTGGMRSYSGSNSEADPPTGNKFSKIHVSNSTDFPQMEHTSTCQESNNYFKGGSVSDEPSEYEDWQLRDRERGLLKSDLDKTNSLGGIYSFSPPINRENIQKQAPAAQENSSQLHTSAELGVLEVDGFGSLSEESMSSWSSIASVLSTENDLAFESLSFRELLEVMDETPMKRNGLPRSRETPRMDVYESISKQPGNQQYIDFQSGSHALSNQPSPNNYQHEISEISQLESKSITKLSKNDKAQAQRWDSTVHNVPHVEDHTEKSFDTEERTGVENQKHQENRLVEDKSKEQVCSSQQHCRRNASISKANKKMAESEKKNAFDWDSFRKQAVADSRKKQRSKDAIDSLDYEAVRCADVNEISKAIRDRGMNNLLAERIKDFLNRLVNDHGSIDLEWLKDVPPDKSKDYLLSVRGLGLKSVECVRLLTLHQLAFPVDTNVGRIAVRLGWVPLRPLPESLQLHLLELYPVLESIQKYLWPRLCKLDQRTLYELHYQLITFGKVFCTKNKPNCNACPMRGECRHFASAFASARLALPGPEERGIVKSTDPIAAERHHPAVVINPLLLPPPDKGLFRKTCSESGRCEPIVEVPSTPEQECTEISELDMEDSLLEDPDEIPTIKLSMEEFKTTLQNYIPEGDMSKALVALNPAAASIPTPKLKNVSRLRTEHQVFELPDSHPLLEGMDRREPDDPSPYLLAIWTPGETANSVQPPETSCGSQDPSSLCNDMACYSCNSLREANSQTVRGTLLIPCRTAMKGSFPLNGTYFQVNEVFADHDSSLNPIDVPRALLWNLPRRTVYFGTSVTTIFKGLSTEGVQYCFWRGFVCVRGFDKKTRAPRPLIARLHFPASKLVKTKNGSKT